MKKIFSRKMLFAVVVAGVVVLAYFLNAGGFLNKSKGIVHGILSPVQSFFYQAGRKTTDYASAIFFLSRAASENRDLEDQNEKLRADLARMAEVARENEALRERLNLPADEKFNFISADVVGYDPVNFGQNIFIGKGLTDGLANDMAVVSPGGALVGKIIEIGQSTATVRLLADQNSAVNVITQSTRSTGILKGSGDGRMAIEMIPQDKNIDIGESVITSGLGGILPKGLLVGTVEKIISSDVEAFKKAQVRPAANTSSLILVLVIMGK